MNSSGFSKAPKPALKNKQAARVAAAFAPCSPCPSPPPRYFCSQAPSSDAESHRAPLATPLLPENIPSPCFGSAKGGRSGDTFPSSCTPWLLWEDAGDISKEPGAPSVLALAMVSQPSTRRRANPRRAPGLQELLPEHLPPLEQRHGCLRDENTSSAAPPPPDIWESRAAAPSSFPALLIGVITHAANHAERHARARGGSAASRRERAEEPSPLLSGGRGHLSWGLSLISGCAEMKPAEGRLSGWRCCSRKVWGVMLPEGGCSAPPSAARAWLWAGSIPSLLAQAAEGTAASGKAPDG